MKKPRKTRAQLERYTKELEAQLASTFHFADHDLRNMARKDWRASGVMVEVTALGGAQVMRPVVIRDGLSPATVEALQADIRRSYVGAVEFKPSGLKD